MTHLSCVPAGLTHTPLLEKGEVSFHPKELESYLPYTKAMREFMSKYDEEKQKDNMKFDDCGSKVQMNERSS